MPDSLKIAFVHEVAVHACICASVCLPEAICMEFALHTY